MSDIDNYFSIYPIILAKKEVEKFNYQKKIN